MIGIFSITLLLLFPYLGHGEKVQGKEEVDRPWSATADLSLAITEGNSATQTLAVRGDLDWTGERNRVIFKFDGLRSDTADDRFRQVVPGVVWEPGAQVPDTESFLVEPGIAADTEKYYLELRLDGAASGRPDWKKIPGRRTWHVGTSWDRNRDAGIVGRTIAFAGLGNIWWRRDQEELRTSYSLSWTDRQVAQDDPEKEASFLGLRAGLSFLDRWGPHVTFDHDTRVNWNLEDTRDYSVDMSNALAVPLGGHFSLKVSLQWLYNSEPFLEDIDVVARVEVRDPDGLPGNGDEYFETVEEGGASLTVSTVRERKKSLDTVFRTSLSYAF